METKQTLKAVKNSSQFEKSIFVNLNKVTTDIEKVNSVKTYVELAADALMQERIDPKHAISVLQNRYSDIQNEYIETENQKLEAAAKLLGGASALLDMAREKINSDAAQKVAELKAKIKTVSWEMYVYFEYFQFADGAWTLKNDYQKQIERLNSIILTDPLEVERYEKYVKLVDLLNELKADNVGTSLQTIINSMVNYNHSTGDFSMRFKIFDTENVLPSYF